MKETIVLSLASLLLCGAAYAQGSPTGIGYIPGMPVPQAAPAGGAPADSSAGKAGNAAQDGKVARVRVVGKDDAKANGAKTDGEAQAEPKAGVALDADSADKRAEYKGVTPPVRLEPENKATFSRTSANQLSWIGFMPDEGGHRIFLQTSKATTYERISTAADRVEIVIADTRLAVSNNQRELDMSYFQTPFAKARATQQKKNVRVVIQLKNPVECRVEQHDNIIEVIASK